MAAIESTSSWRPQPQSWFAPPIAQAPRPTRVISRPVAPSAVVASGVVCVIVSPPGRRGGCRPTSITSAASRLESASSSRQASIVAPGSPPSCIPASCNAPRERRRSREPHSGDAIACASPGRAASVGGTMRRPLLIAVDEDREALESLETQLVQRYARDYRVECLGDPDEAVADAEGARATAARTWRSCSRPRRSRDDRGVTCSSTCASFTRTPSGRCWFRRTSGPISRPPTRSATRWPLDASTTTWPGRRVPPTRSSTKPCRGSCSSGRGIGASFRRRFTSSARRGRAGPTS